MSSDVKKKNNNNVTKSANLVQINNYSSRNSKFQKKKTFSSLKYEPRRNCNENTVVKVRGKKIIIRREHFLLFTFERNEGIKRL